MSVFTPLLISELNINVHTLMSVFYIVVITVGKVNVSHQYLHYHKC